MTAPHDRLACGDQVRVTFKGAVIEASPNGRLVLQAHDDGTTGQYEPVIFSWSERQSSDFQIERIEPPLAVGDRVSKRSSLGVKRQGELAALHTGKAWVRWDSAPMSPAEYATFNIEDLERIA